MPKKNIDSFLSIFTVPSRTVSYRMYLSAVACTDGSWKEENNQPSHLEHGISKIMTCPHDHDHHG